VGITRAGLYPQVDGAATYQRTRTSENMVAQREAPAVQEFAGQVAQALGLAQTASLLTVDPAQALLSIPGQIAGWPFPQSVDWESDYYRAGIDAAWEVDIFGGTRRGVEAAQADLDATRENLKDVWVSLAGAVAQHYIALRTYQARLRVAESNLEAQVETYELLESLFRSGLRDGLAVQQARYIMENTRASIPLLRTGIEASMNSLAVLTGSMPGDLHERLSETKPIPVPSLTVVTGIPANVLRQRPDIRMAERELAAQTARVGEAEAELYPKFFLTGSIGLESLKSSTLFDSGSEAWGIGPSISWPIFHAGAIRKNIQVQTELQEQYLAYYENTVLMAVKEVREALVAYAEEQRRRDALLNAVDAASSALEVARDKYKNGLSDFNNVLDAQRSLLAYEEQLAMSEGTISTNLVRLYKALGGGWGPLVRGENASEDAPVGEG
jgi:NodT family efflux transporter outer membrane factor (OMF) lipoprotein